MNNDQNYVPNPDEIEDLPPAKKRKKKVLTDTEIKIKKAKRKKLGVAVFVLLLAIGVTGNWYYENSNISATIEPLISSAQQKKLGQAEYVGATTNANAENEYFASARVERQQARDEQLDKLQKIINDSNQTEKAKNSATEKITNISSYIAIENKIETLVTAKGVDNCLAIVDEKGTRVDVIVDVEELSDNVVLQIKEIAMQQLDVSFENVCIIQSNK